MKVALFCRAVCREAIQTMEYFQSHQARIDLVVVETGVREKFSRAETEFGRAHAEFNRIVLCEQSKPVEKYNPLRFLWSRLPIEFRAWIKRVIGRREALLDGRPDTACFSRKHGITTAEVERHSSAQTKCLLEEHEIDCVLLASSAWLIKDPLLSIPRIKIINVHPAMLPRHRSLDSLPWSVLEEDTIGHTAHFVDAGVDTGPILLFEEVGIEDGDTLLSLRDRINRMKPGLFFKVVGGLSDGTVIPTEQEKADGVHHRPMTVAELVAAEQALQHRLKAWGTKLAGTESGTQKAAIAL